MKENNGALKEKEGKLPLLTVFTPSYNRAGLLKRVYESLKGQTDRDLIWIIVDDGSVDNTGEVVESFKKENLFPIEYVFKENGGKMSAHNLGVSLCKTELFMCLDSDDWLRSDAVELIKGSYKEAKEGILPSFLAGIAAHKGKDEKTPLYEKDFVFPKGGKKIYFAEKKLSDEGALSRDEKLKRYTTLYGQYLRGFKGETTLVYRTELLKEHPFPLLPGEKYVPEDYIYDKIDSDHVLYVLPEILTVCELMESGYTDSLKRLKKENPGAWFLYYEQRLKITPADCFSNLLLKLKYAAYYDIYRKRGAKGQEGMGGAFKINPLWRFFGLFGAFCLLFFKGE